MKENQIVLAVFVGAVIILALLVIGGYIPLRQSSQVPPLRSKDISTTGTIVCLPVKEGGAKTEECAIGLAADDGTFYELTGLDQAEIVDGTISVGKVVEISGALTQENQSDYDTGGTITVDTLITLEDFSPDILN